MAARAGAQPPPHEVIDLLSDSDESDDGVATPRPTRRPSAPLDFDENGDLSPIDEHPFYNAFAGPIASPQAQVNAGAGSGHATRGQILNIGGEDVFIPDEEPPNLAANATTASAIPLSSDDAHALSEEAFTADSCLKRVLEIFPDISHAHVLELYNDFGSNSGYENLPRPARLDNIIEQLVSATSYPKQERGKQAVKKRKREDSIDENDTKRWEGPDREAVPHFLKGSMQAMLKSEFPEIPVNFVNETLATQKHFFQAYVALAAAMDSTKRAFGKGRASVRHLANADTMAMNCGWPELADELTAARKRIAVVRAQRVVDDAKKKAEEENLQRATECGETAECQACFDDLPMNRQMHCDGPVAHFTCYECAETYIKSEVSESRCRVLCTAGCGANFAPAQLNLLGNKQLLEQLAELEQEKAIRDAGLDDLEECPFCDYKAIVPPVEEDFEFRCANSECEKVSCRRCKSVSHIPISCEQHAKDNKVNHRHKIAEAMTAALIRSCNKCKKQFIKEYGCNKMTCPSCANLQCYVCSESLKNYDHFDQAPGRTVAGEDKSKKCPLYDNVEERHEREVKEAEAAARAQIAAENPDVSPDDLEIKVSNAVKKSTADRIKNAGGPGGGGVGRYPYMPAGLRDAMRGLGVPYGAAFLDDVDADLAEAGVRARRRRAKYEAAQRARVAAQDRLPRDPRVLQPPPAIPAGILGLDLMAMDDFIDRPAPDAHINAFPAPFNANTAAYVPPPAPPAPRARRADNRRADYLRFAGDGAGLDGVLEVEPAQPPPHGANDLAVRMRGLQAGRQAERAALLARQVELQAALRARAPAQADAVATLDGPAEARINDWLLQPLENAPRRVAEVLEVRGRVPDGAGTNDWRQRYEHARRGVAEVAEGRDQNQQRAQAQVEALATLARGQAQAQARLQARARLEARQAEQLRRREEHMHRFRDLVDRNDGRGNEAQFYPFPLPDEPGVPMGPGQH